jgi:hypothetical protein
MKFASYVTLHYVTLSKRNVLRMGFEPTIPEFERSKTVHALGRAATVIGSQCLHKYTHFDTVVTVPTLPTLSHFLW